MSGDSTIPEPIDGSAPGSPGFEIRLHTLLGLEFAPFDGGLTRVTMPIGPNAIGANGNLHGGAIATLVDVSSALAAVRSRTIDFEVESLITTDLHVRYLGQPRSASVHADAEVLRAGRQLIVVACTVADEGGHVIASADVGLMVVTRRRPIGTAADAPA